MIEYDPAVDGIGLEQMNTGLQEKLNQCFEHVENHGTEQSLKDEIAGLQVQINLLARVLHAVISDQVLNQTDVDQLNVLVQSQNT